MSIKSYLRKLLEEDDVTDTTNIPVATPVASATVTDTTASSEQSTAATEVTATPSVSTVESDASTVVSDAETEDVDTDKLKSALQVAGHDVSGYWDVAVAFGKKIDADIAAGIKKALDYLGSEAVAVYDEALAIAKLKK